VIVGVRLSELKIIAPKVALIVLSITLIVCFALFEVLRVVPLI